MLVLQVFGSEVHVHKKCPIAAIGIDLTFTCDNMM